MSVRKAPVGAHYGLKDWLVQRVTAFVMVVVIVLFVVILYIKAPSNYEQWRDFIFQGGIRITLMLFVLSLIWHAFIGIRDIYMDYIKNDLLRLMKIVGMIIYLLVCMLWAIRILL